MIDGPNDYLTVPMTVEKLLDALRFVTPGSHIKIAAGDRLMNVKSVCEALLPGEGVVVVIEAGR